MSHIHIKPSSNSSSSNNNNNNNNNSNDDLILESIDNFNVNAVNETNSNSTSLQKQLVNYKLQQKILSDLLRQVLSGNGDDDNDDDANGYRSNNQLNPLLLNPLINQVIQVFSSLVENNNNNNNNSNGKYQNEQNEALLQQLSALSSETNITLKLQSMIKIFNLVIIDLSSKFSNVKSLITTQAEKIAYLQFLIDSHLKQSVYIFNVLGDKNLDNSNINSKSLTASPSSIQGENEYLIKISNLNSQANDLNATILKKDQELANLKAELESFRNLKTVHDDINNKKISELNNKLKFSNQQLYDKDLLIQQLKAKLSKYEEENNNNNNNNDDDDADVDVNEDNGNTSAVAITNEVLRIHEINQNVVAISKQGVQDVIGSDKEIIIYSNFNDTNLIENNLVEMITLLNQKLIEKNVILGKLSASINQLNTSNNDLLADKLTLNKNIVSLNNSISKLVNKSAFLENNLDNCIVKFQDLLSLDIKSYSKFTEAFTKIIDEVSLSQAREKLSKLIHQNQRNKNPNYEKILYLTEAIHHYFNSAVETIVSEHVSLMLDSGEKQRSDSSIIHNLQEKIQSVVVENEKLKTQVAKRTRSLQQRTAPPSSQLLSNEDGNITSSSESMAAANGGSAGSTESRDSPRSKARIEELTKRLKGEREKRLLEYRASEKKLKELEMENEYLRRQSQT